MYLIPLKDLVDMTISRDNNKWAKAAFLHLYGILGDNNMYTTWKKR